MSLWRCYIYISQHYGTEGNYFRPEPSADRCALHIELEEKLSR